MINIGEMLKKFNPLLFVDVVLDPRYKLHYISWSLDDLYDKELASCMFTFTTRKLAVCGRFGRYK